MVLRQPRSKLVLSLTPLIDVVFILLIFFMLASQFVDWRQIGLTPQAQLSGVMSDQQISSLHMLNDGSFLVNGRSSESLSAAIFELKSYGKDRTIFLSAQEEVEIQSVIDVVEALSRDGLSGVHLSEAEPRVVP